MTYQEFLQRYLPKYWERERRKKLTAIERAKEDAQRAIEKMVKR